MRVHSRTCVRERVAYYHKPVADEVGIRLDVLRSSSFRWSVTRPSQQKRRGLWLHPLGEETCRKPKPRALSGQPHHILGRRDAEHTAADLAFAIAVALSWWAARNGKAKLNVPRAPVVQEAGNRVGWADVPPQVMRGWVMAATAVRLGLTPPAKQPGTWFPIEDTAEVTCWKY